MSTYIFFENTSFSRVSHFQMAFATWYVISWLCSSPKANAKLVPDVSIVVTVIYFVRETFPMYAV